MTLTDAVLPAIIADIHGPIDVGCASAYVERHPELALPRMVIVREPDLNPCPAPQSLPLMSLLTACTRGVSTPSLQTAHDPPMTDAAIAMFLEFLDEVFTQSDEPFSVLWNVRRRLPHHRAVQDSHCVARQGRPIDVLGPPRKAMPPSFAAPLRLVHG